MAFPSCTLFLAAAWLIGLALHGAASAAEMGRESHPIVLAAAAGPEAAPKSYGQCTVCHAFKKGAAHKIGPNLYGVLGRKIGSAKGFAYSSSARRASFRWDEKRLRALIRKPKTYRKYLRKALHSWRAHAAKTLERELIPFFREISPSVAGKR
jgi:cytochrome c2